MKQVEDLKGLIGAIAQTGRKNPSPPPIHHIDVFDGYFLDSGEIDRDGLDTLDCPCTRREVLLRFLLLNAVVDQGPDVVGVRRLLVDVTNDLYKKSIRFLHKPSEFFNWLGVAADRVHSRHMAIAKRRAEEWARENQSVASKYNLFMDNSRQVLSYVVFRWGVPLALPMMLEQKRGKGSPSTALLDFLESFDSAEAMSQGLKDDTEYGLGKAIGDKACHLFAKWLVFSFRLTRRNEPSWGPFSFEVPYDSNAGRVLWRTGYLLKWASETEYQRTQVIQPKRGKGGTHYIRVTNIRGMTTNCLPNDLQSAYKEVAVEHLMTHRRLPRKVEIQRVQHAYLLSDFASTGLSVGHFDDGLMYIGTRFCLNHDKPHCSQCPINAFCEGHQSRPELIENYRT